MSVPVLGLLYTLGNVQFPAMNVQNVPVIRNLLCEQVEAICNTVKVKLEYSSLLVRSVPGKTFHVVLLSFNCSSEM